MIHFCTLCIRLYNYICTHVCTHTGALTPENVGHAEFLALYSIYSIYRMLRLGRSPSPCEQHADVVEEVLRVCVRAYFDTIIGVFWQCQKRPILVSKEAYTHTYIAHPQHQVWRDTCSGDIKRPMIVPKEAYTSVKRGLYTNVYRAPAAPSVARHVLW